MRCGATIALSWVLIFGAFYALPIGHESGLRAFLRLGADIALIGAVFVWQIRRISMAELPELRAIEALGIVIALFLVAFSGIYVAMSHESVATFTKPLDHTRALYFTITIFSTVGFGDITPRTDTARLVVSAQMLLDLAIIGASRPTHLRNAARTRTTRCPSPLRRPSRQGRRADKRPRPVRRRRCLVPPPTGHAQKSGGGASGEDAREDESKRTLRESGKGVGAGQSEATADQVVSRLSRIRPDVQPDSQSGPAVSTSSMSRRTSWQGVKKIVVQRADRLDDPGGDHTTSAAFNGSFDLSGIGREHLLQLSHLRRLERREFPLEQRQLWQPAQANENSTRAIDLGKKTTRSGICPRACSRAPDSLTVADSQGTIVAPNQAVTLKSNGQFNGSVFAASLTGGGRRTSTLRRDDALARTRCPALA